MTGWQNRVFVGRLASGLGDRRLSARIAMAAVAVAACSLLAPAAGAWAAIPGGTQRWSATYDAGAPAFSYAVAVSPDGSTVFSTGSTNYDTTAPGHFATVAVDARTGVVKWSASYRSSVAPGQRDKATRIAVSPDGSKVFVTGNSACFSSNCEGSFSGFSTVAYDASTGQKLWSSQYAEAGPGGYSIAVSPDGSKVFVNGGSANGIGDTTIAYDAATGHQLFVIPNANLLVPWKALAVSPDSSTVFVATLASTHQSPPCGYEIAAYDSSTGALRWSAFYPSCDSESYMTIALSPDGSTLYAASDGSLGVGLVAYDASTGTQLWTTAVNDMRFEYSDTEPSLEVSPDGSRVFLLGYYQCPSSCPDQPLVTAAYDTSSGNQLWESQYDSGGRTYPADLAVSADGSHVFVTGQAELPGTSQVDAPLVTYDAGNGAEAWATTYQDNVGWALAGSPDSSTVYVAGTFTTAASATGAALQNRGELAQSKTSCSSGACGFSVTAYDTHAGPGRSQDGDPSLEYDGWLNFFDKTALGGAYRASRTTGQTVTFKTAATTSVTWVTHLGHQEGRARVLIDGHSKGIFDLYSPTASSHAYRFDGLSPKAHVITIRVLGTKDAASKGRWVPIDAFHIGPNVNEESALKVHYDAWKNVSNRAASGGTYRESASPHSRVSLAFTGRRVNWITTTGPSYGRARVVVDGVGHTVDLYRPQRHWRVKFSYARLGSGTHHITIIPLGTKDRASTSRNIAVDAFIVH